MAVTVGLGQRLLPRPNDVHPVEASAPVQLGRARLRRRSLLDSLPAVLQVEDVARPFAQSLHALATGYNALSESLQAKQRTAWRGGMGQLVRKYHDIVIPAYSSVQVSEARDVGADPPAGAFHPLLDLRQEGSISCGRGSGRPARAARLTGGDVAGDGVVRAARLLGGGPVGLHEVVRIQNLHDLSCRLHVSLLRAALAR